MPGVEWTGDADLLNSSGRAWGAKVEAYASGTADAAMKDG
jgi:hypothetical protein